MIEASRQQVFLPMAMWPMEPLTALDMWLDSIQST
jgi:hypothetical protein